MRLSRLARAVNLSVVRLQHLFKQETGVCITQLVMDRRLAEAASLLTRSQLTVKQVCHRVGFNDVTNFHKRFKRQFGMGPAAFRAEAKTASLLK